MSLVPGSVERGSQRVIYAYSHVRTHQVLYSFTPNLHNASVARQFPDTGANTSFTHLRKDLWRPLWTLTIPESEHANAQGRHVFKKLREWRKLHETSWEPPAMLSLNHSKKEIERLQEKLDQRGGSKKNNVYDVIKHYKKKMRVAAVLDQRANSVADLAAVLASQEELGASTQQSKETEAKERRDFQIQLMLDLAKEAEEGGLEPLETRIRELRKMEAKAKESGEPMELSRAQFQRELSEVRLRAKKMRGSVAAVKEATEKIKQTNPSISGQQLESRLREVLPGLPTPDGSVPKRGPLRARIARANAPEFSTEGITIKWANQLDAEYAESWPATIAHQAMGFSRHRAPRADQEAVLDVVSLRSNVAQAYEAKHGLAPVSEETADAEAKKPTKEETDRKAAVKMVKGRILDQVRKSVAKSVDRRLRQAGRGLPPVSQTA